MTQGFSVATNAYGVQPLASRAFTQAWRYPFFLLQPLFARTTRGMHPSVRKIGPLTSSLSNTNVIPATCTKQQYALPEPLTKHGHPAAQETNLDNTTTWEVWTLRDQMYFLTRGVAQVLLGDDHNDDTGQMFSE